MRHYVCDRCGNLWDAYHASDCPACRSKNLWEFPPNAADHAAQHARLILDRLSPAPYER